MDKTFTQMPVVLDVSIYDKTREWIIDFFSRISDVASVYEYGTVNSPGLSDLDLMVVLKDDPKDKNLYEALTFKNIPENLTVLIDNDAVKFISKNHFRDIRLLSEFRTKLLWGEEIEINDISSQQLNLVKITSVMDFLPERILSLVSYSGQKLIPVTDAIGLLNSYLYSAKAAQEIMNKRIDDVFAFENELKNLRTNWFRFDFSQQTQQLSRIIEKCIFSSLKIIDELAELLVERGLYLCGKYARGATFYFNSSKGFMFYDDSRSVGADIEKRLIFDGDRCFFLVPAIWLSHFYCYGQGTGIISSKIKNNIILEEMPDSPYISLEMSKVLLQRIGLCNEMANFFNKYGIPLSKLHRFGHIKSKNKENSYYREDTQ